LGFLCQWGQAHLTLHPAHSFLSQHTYTTVPKLLCHFVPLNKTLIRFRLLQFLQISISIFLIVPLYRFLSLCLLNFRNGEVEESHRSQPVLQGSQKRNQKAKEASSHFNQRGMYSFFHLSVFSFFIDFFWLIIIVYCYRLL
jgi:hypothetical protein